jgi:hypothetical protein
MKKFTILALSFLISYQHALAQNQCQKIFEQTLPQSFPVSQKTQVLIQAAEWLSINAHQIQPETTHLEPLVPYTLSMIDKVRQELPNKSFEPLYDSYRNYVNQVLDEVQLRVSEKNLTYEYLFGLPIRLAFLLTMRETTSLSGPEPQSVLEAYRYADHNLFIQMFKEASTYQRPGFRPSSFKDYYYIYDSFPFHITLPTVGNINYRTLNALVSLNVWPVGIAMKPVQVDGQSMDELMFALHDLGHIKSLELVLGPEGNIPLTLIRKVMRSVFLKLETASLSRLDFESLHFLHFIYFHESIGIDFQLLKNGTRVTQISTQSVLEGFIKHLTDVASNLTALDAPGLEDIQQEFDKVLRGQRSREDTLRILVPVYQNFLEQAAKSIIIDDAL